MTGITRYQGAIIKDHHILLIKQTEHASGRSYWLIPGGGIEPGETEEVCVQREVLERRLGCMCMSSICCSMNRAFLDILNLSTVSSQ